MPEQSVALDPGACSGAELEQIFDRAIAPRPIGLISTLGPAGRPMLHPVTWYSTASVNPPVQYFAVMEQDGPRGELLLAQLVRQGEFVINSVDETIARSLAAIDDDGGDLLAAGLRAAPSVKVAPYRIAESPAQMECRLLDILPLGGGAAHLVFGGVAQFHVREGLEENGRVDQRRFGPVGKLAGDLYCRCTELYRMRPGEAT
jgi:flavin reductase (DIM6/NTAB) family NADH-FMN oxidoreductase RutF